MARCGCWTRCCHTTEGLGSSSVPALMGAQADWWPVYLFNSYIVISFDAMQLLIFAEMPFRALQNTILPHCMKVTSLPRALLKCQEQERPQRRVNTHGLQKAQSLQGSVLLPHPTPIATNGGPPGPLSIFFVCSDIKNTDEPDRQK